MNILLKIISVVCNFLWGDLITIPLPGGSSIGISLLVLILVPTGIYFTIRTKFLPIRCFPEMIRVTLEKQPSDKRSGISGFQALVVSTATRVGMGNMVGVVAAIAVGGAGAVFWMWVTALIGSSTAFIEATLAQLHKQEDPLYPSISARHIALKIRCFKPLLFFSSSPSRFFMFSLSVAWSSGQRDTITGIGRLLTKYCTSFSVA